MILQYNRIINLDFLLLVFFFFLAKVSIMIPAVVSSSLNKYLYLLDFHFHLRDKDDQHSQSFWALCVWLLEQNQMVNKVKFKFLLIQDFW